MLILVVLRSAGPRLLRRGRARAEYKLVIVELHVRSECTAASASSVSLRIVALPAADAASRVNGPTFTAPPGGRSLSLMSVQPATVARRCRRRPAMRWVGAQCRPARRNGTLREYRFSCCEGQPRHSCHKTRPHAMFMRPPGLQLPVGSGAMCAHLGPHLTVTPTPVYHVGSALRLLVRRFSRARCRRHSLLNPRRPWP